MAGAGHGEFSWRLESRSGHAEVGVRILGRGGILSRSGGQQGDLVNNVLHLVGERFGLYRRGKHLLGIAKMRLGFGMTAEVQRRSEPFTGTHAAF